MSRGSKKLPQIELALEEGKDSEDCPDPAPPFYQFPVILSSHPPACLSILPCRGQDIPLLCGLAWRMP